MLVLTRKQTQTILVGDQITITILRIKGQTVRVGVQAPETMRIMRGEILDVSGITSQDFETPNASTDANRTTEARRDAPTATRGEPRANRMSSFVAARARNETPRGYRRGEPMLGVPSSL